MKFKSKIVGVSVVFLFFSSACGVKGPPLPPVADTPDASEREDKEIARVEPSPTPSPTPTTKTKKKKSR